VVVEQVLLYHKIINEYKLPWLKLKIEVPYKEIEKEAIALKSKFVKHRDGEKNNGYYNTGWSSLCIHGIEDSYTNHYTTYGYKSHEEVPYVWTEASKSTPHTVRFLQSIPFKQFYRVRFMLLEPGGFIALHKDMEEHRLSPINIAITQPKHCYFKMKDVGIVPFEVGDAFLLDVAHEHALINNSQKDRYHMIIHGIPDIKWKEIVIDSFNQT